ncbi:hypothetical protein NXS19_001605 [Fusarium pseudograminearum]|nr:hypothetical protein NXS19_001605 [Fusarium pseudograminearum]
MLEYLEDMGQGPPLLPSDPKSKAKCRFWIGHINRHIVPNFHKLVQNQDPSFEHGAADRLQGSINTLVGAADEKGPFSRSGPLPRRHTPGAVCSSSLKSSRLYMWVVSTTVWIALGEVAGRH